MAFYSAQIDTPRSARGFFRRVMDRVMTRLEAQAAHMSRRDQILALEAKTDEELAEIGVKRAEIAYHVFRDRFYT